MDCFVWVELHYQVRVREIPCTHTHARWLEKVNDMAQYHSRCRTCKWNLFSYIRLFSLLFPNRFFVVGRSFFSLSSRCYLVATNARARCKVNNFTHWIEFDLNDAQGRWKNYASCVVLYGKMCPPKVMLLVGMIMQDRSPRRYQLQHGYRCH